MYLTRLYSSCSEIASIVIVINFNCDSSSNMSGLELVRQYGDEDDEGEEEEEKEEEKNEEGVVCYVISQAAQDYINNKIDDVSNVAKTAAVKRKETDDAYQLFYAKLTNQSVVDTAANTREAIETIQKGIFLKMLSYKVTCPGQNTCI